MNDKKRITAWLANDDKWLNEQKVRIEHQTNGQHQCTVLTNSSGHKALFYVNGYFDNGLWVAAAAKAESPVYSH
jgi:V8-like Glu-specific endopeptidase